jgi:hypothetical protein
MKSMKMLVPYLLAFLLLVAVNAMAGASNQDIPISGQVTNPCNGETVTFSGIVHLTFNLTFDGGGGFHLVQRDNIHVTATGNLGNSYEGNESDILSLNGRFGVEQTIGSTFSEISLGKAPNFEQHFLQHVTVNANGTVTVFFTNFTANCRG